MSDMSPEIGKTYELTHPFGKATVKVLGGDNDFLRLRIIKGTLTSPRNTWEAGDAPYLRESRCEFRLQNSQ